MFANDGQHAVGIGGFFQGFAEIGFVEQFGTVGERVEVFLELALRDEEQHDELHGLVIEGIEVDPLGGAAERADDLVDQIRGGMRNADAETNARGH